MPEAPAQVFSAVGRSLPRPDGGEKVAGATRFAADIRLPGMLYCRLVLSPYAHARCNTDTATRACHPPRHLPNACVRVLSRRRPFRRP